MENVLIYALKYFVKVNLVLNKSKLVVEYSLFVLLYLYCSCLPILVHIFHFKRRQSYLQLCKILLNNDILLAK